MRAKPRGTATPKVQKIEVFPADPVVQQIGASAAASASWPPTLTARIRDVTREAFLESGNNEVATRRPGRSDDRTPAW